MANIEFGQLATATSLDGSEVFCVVQNGLSKHAQVSQIPGQVPIGGSTGQVLGKASDDSYDTAWISATGLGSVTSVGIAVPTSLLTVSNTPITSAGTTTLGLASQAPNTVLIGPASGTSVAPTFRLLTNGDLPVINAVTGGTGQSTYTAGDLLYANTGTTLAKLPATVSGNVLLSAGTATAPAWGPVNLTSMVSGSLSLSNLQGSATGNAIIAAGATSAPTWGKIDLSTSVTGTLPSSSGGIGISTFTIGDLLYANTGTSLAKLLATATGKVLTSAGTGTAPAYAQVNLTSMVTGILPVANGGTAGSTAAAGVAGLGLRQQLTATTNFYCRTAPVALTSISNASPAVFTLVSHGLSINDPVVLTTTGALPNGLTAGTIYYVISAGFTSSTFEVSATQGGAAINTTSAGSGTHSFQTGNDSNDGTAATRANAWLTLQGSVVNVQENYDTRDHPVQLNLAAGLYTSSSDLLHMDQKVLGGGGGGQLIINGAGSTTILESTAGNTMAVYYESVLGISNLKLQSTLGFGLIVDRAGRCTLNGGITFGTCTSGHIAVTDGGACIVSGTTSIVGGGTRHVFTASGGRLQYSFTTANIDADVTITTFAEFSSLSYQSWSGTTINLNGHTVTGQKYSGSYNAVCLAGITLPGGTSGTTTTGSWFL